MLKLVFALALGAAVSYASSITTASCTFGSITATGSGSGFSTCSVGNAGGDANAAENAGVQAYVGSEGDVSFAYSETLDQLRYRGAVSTSASELVQFTTAGPARIGFLDYTFDFGSRHGGGMFDGNIQQGSTLVQEPSCLPGYLGCQMSGIIPFELGKPFSVQTDSYVSMVETEPGMVGYDDASSSIYMTLFESDGITPVTILDDGTPVPLNATPEPCTYALGLLGATVLLVFRKKSEHAR